MRVMENDFITKAKEIINTILYITIATVSKDGIPWNSPVYSAFDENYNFYWRSGKDSQHSRNIKENPNVFIVVYDSTIEWGKGRGVFIQAKAHELTGEVEIKKALSYLDQRVGQTVGGPKIFTAENPRRVYKAVPEKVWMNTDSEENGKFVDVRVEVDLFAK